MLARCQRKRFRVADVLENRWVNGAVLGLAVAVMAVSVVYLWLGWFSPDGVPTVAGHRLLVVLSGSMKPAFDAGDIVVVREFDPRTALPGQIVTFRDPTSPRVLITHRVAEVVREGHAVFYRTKGDANDVVDAEPVPWQNVIGRVVLHIPYVGYLVSFVRTVPGLLLSIMLPGAIILAGELRAIVRLVRGVGDKPRLEGR